MKNDFESYAEPANSHSLFASYSISLLYAWNNSIFPAKGKGCHRNDVDEHGYELTGVNIIEKGTTNGTVSDIDGKFQVTLQQENSILQFSYIGFLTTEVIPGSQTTLRVVLREDMTWWMKWSWWIWYNHKKEVTGLDRKPERREFCEGKYYQPYAVVAGPGGGYEYVKPGGGDPNGSFSVSYGVWPLFRGCFPFSCNWWYYRGSLESINVEEIESIDVLKDGSAAATLRYKGNQWGNSYYHKKGLKAPKKAHWFSTYVAMQTVAKKLDVLTAQQFRMWSVITIRYERRIIFSVTSRGLFWRMVTRTAPLSQYLNVAFPPEW